MNCNVKRVLLIAGICFVAVMSFFNHNMVINAASDATVNLNVTHQIIRGFGGSSAWSGALSDATMDALFKTAGFSILRLRIDPNNAWSDELSNAKKAVARGAIVFATPWSAPASMKTNNNVVGGSLSTSQYANYANYLKSFVSYLSQNGVSLYAISLQNEPDYVPTTYEGCGWTGAQFDTFLQSYGSTIAGATKIMMPESCSFNTSESDNTLNDANASSYVSIIGEHLYGATIKNYSLALSKGKEVWETEHYYDGDDITTAMTVAKEVHDCMVTGNMSAYVWWWMTNSTDGIINSSNVLNKRGYILSQFAKYARPGYYRVDATANPQTNVYVSAYKGNNQVVIVAINTGTASVSQNFVLQNGTTSQVSSWQTTSSSNMAAGPTYTASSGSFNATLPGQSITTFVGTLGTVNVTPTPTSTTATPTPTPTSGPRSAFSQIEAESFNTQSGIQTESCGEGGQDVGYIENGDYAVYNNIDFGSGATSFQARVASNTSGGNIEIRLDSVTGALVGTCPVAGTGGWQTWVTSTCSVSGVSGTHNLYLVFTGGSGYLFNINWFQFTSGSVTPTPTPTPTPVVTSTPVVTLSPNPTVPVTPTPTPRTPPGAIKVQFYNQGITDPSNQIYMNFQLVNTGSSAINLSNVKLRYWYTEDGTQAQNFYCDYSPIGSSNVTGTFVKMGTAKTGADTYVEIGFTSGAGSLNPGASTQVQCRCAKSDWSNYTQSNDYSFNSSATSYVDWTKVTGYVSGALAWGTEP